MGDSGEQLMQYGLDNPEYIIRIVTIDGAKLTLELGGFRPGRQQRLRAV